MKNAIKSLIASIISVIGANILAPIIFGANLEPGDEALALAVWIFVALWAMSAVAERFVWQAVAARIAAPQRRRVHKSSEINLLDLRYLALRGEMLERRGR